MPMFMNVSLWRLTFSYTIIFARAASDRLTFVNYLPFSMPGEKAARSRYASSSSSTNRRRSFACRSRAWPLPR
ncbi:hypothetical protein C7S13_4701 [Burkholderia cepacia]|nr:hypothetical protein [Burkholderia cepacia]